MGEQTSSLSGSRESAFGVNYCLKTLRRYFMSQTNNFNSNCRVSEGMRASDVVVAV